MANSNEEIMKWYKVNICSLKKYVLMLGCGQSP